MKEIMEDFYRISGMLISVYDRQMRCVASAGPEGRSYCRVIQQSGDALKCCFRSDLNAFNRVAETGKSYYYTCPFGLFEAMIPIWGNKELLGFLFVGQAIEDTPGRISAAKTAAVRYLGENQLPDGGREIVDSLAHFSKERLESFSHVLEMLAEYIASKGLFPAQPKSAGQLVRDFLIKNYHRKISLAELGLYLHCSTVTLTENFRKEFGMTIMQCLQEIRLENAEKLLRNSDLPVGNVAEKCGFSSGEYFSNVFKRRYGMSPAAYRKCR